MSFIGHQSTVKIYLPGWSICFSLKKKGIFIKQQICIVPRQDYRAKFSPTGVPQKDGVGFSILIVNEAGPSLMAPLKIVH